MKKWILFIFIVLSANQVQAQIFELNIKKDGIFLGGVSGLNIAYLILEKHQPVLSLEAISNLDVSSVNTMDRWVTEQWSPDSSSASDIGLYTSVALPVTLLFFREARKEWLALAVMYAESMLLTSGLTGTIKAMVGRPRPYAYNPLISNSYKQTTSTVQSFFSGHTSSSFTGAAYFSTVFSLYYPDSPWKGLVITGSFSIAAATGILRITAGKHFVTDVIAGAVVGTLSGWLLPLLHYKVGLSESVSLFQGENTGLYYTYCFK